MTIDQLKEKLATGLAACESVEAKLKFAAEGLAQIFSVRNHEVVLFSVNQKKHEITFVWPLSMAKIGHIPLNAINSLVAKTANEQKSYLDNAFAGSRHLFIFEHMLAEKNERIPVQKIMSAPIIGADGVTVGVVQISRKATSPVEAGDDFTEGSLAALESLAVVLLPCLA
ncbi:MAG: hypothetical protein FIA91_03005 [Geobacter sp.]|nr:hypothetical protein [Geobacter sp.]